MSDGKMSIFYTGATGYIGGAVLQRILAHPKASTFEITALVRSAEKAKILESKFGLKAVVGSLQDLEKLTENAANAHVVIHTADADDLSAMQAILAGMKQRHEKTGDLPILIHTSGTGLLKDDARGEYASEKIISDLDMAALDAFPPTAFHHAVDLLAISADTDGYTRSYLVLPSMIYGLGTGPLYEAGVSNRHTLQIPILAKIFLDRGQPGIMGTAANMWPNVHIDDVADFYYLLFDAALSKPDTVSHGRTGYFFIENGEHTLYSVCSAIGAELAAAGAIPAENAQPSVLTPEERVRYFGSEFVVGIHFSNARCRADRGRKELGWVPRYTTEDMLRSVRSQVEAVLQDRGSK